MAILRALDEPQTTDSSCRKHLRKNKELIPADSDLGPKM